MKTGAAYVPIDPAVPAARMEFVLDDAAPVAAITTAGLAERLDGRDLLVVDVDDPAVAGQPVRRCRRRRPDDIAYIIYTSGTTGTPKGVAIPHRNVTRLLETLDADMESGRAGVDAVSFAGVRLSRCGRSGVRCSTAAGWWWCPTRWSARRRISTPLLVAEEVTCLESDPVGVLCAASR